jgi:hypothetical protein
VGDNGERERQEKGNEPVLFCEAAHSGVRKISVQSRPRDPGRQGGLIRENEQRYCVGTPTEHSLSSVLFQLISSSLYEKAMVFYC